MKRPNRPTAAELEILDVLWNRQSATVREIHDAIKQKRHTTYTTVLKLMQIMHEKGLVKRDETAKAHIYKPAYSQHQTRKKLVGDLLDRAFNGSALKLVQHVLETEPSSTEELAEIRRLIREAEDRGEKR